ncbi:hypothetical protein ASwh1_384 [Aeromonas phage Aswh_1]|nr:hypothetical protein ASwh1_384 [Aeromonas phage Aswh_1]
MKGKRYTVKKVNENFEDFFPELVVGASFTVNEEAIVWNSCLTKGATIITMDSGTVYNAEDGRWPMWAFYTDSMVGEYLIPDKKYNKLMRWEKREKELIAELEFHRKNKPI